MSAGNVVGPWRRLDARMIVVDALRVLVSLLPGAVAFWVVGVQFSLGTVGPFAAVALWGVVSSAHDVVRWVMTRYRLTGEYVEIRTGLLVRRHRGIRRDRIRSVDSNAKLRHRLAGLRQVTIGAGQQNTAYEAALSLDAVSRREAAWLRRALVGDEQDVPQEERGVQEFARIRYRWIVYNLFNIWAYAMAFGVLSSAGLLALTFGVDVGGMVAGLVDWSAIGWLWGAALVLVVTGAVGVVGLGAQFVSANWDFRLVRAPGEHGTVLRTTQGLLRTREVNRDDRRLRGAEISEPLPWRWMGMADTRVITTGLSVWSEAPTILPRGPVRLARTVVSRVLGEERSPLDAALASHPRAALRRRMLWATGVTALAAGVAAWLGATVPAVPTNAWMWVLGVGWPLTLLLAVAAYRALGHAIVGRYLVVRAGMVSRATAAFQRRAVSGIALRQSVLQRRLGLVTVSATTAAGWGIYEAPDVSAAESVRLADEAAPEFLREFLQAR